MSLPQDEAPFADRLELVRFEPLAVGEGHSGGAFRVEDDEGRAYKLRACGRAGRAREIERFVGLVPDIFPKLLGRDRRFLLFTFLEGYRSLTRRELLDASVRVGALTARVHRAGRQSRLLGGPGAWLVAARWRFQLARDLALLASREVVPVATLRTLRSKLAERRTRFGLPFELELDDVHKANFMIAPDEGDLRYVDEEAIGIRPRGLALATLLKTANLSETLESFREGYDSEADASWIEPAYVEYLLLLDAVRRVAHKIRNEVRLAKLPEEVAELAAIGQSLEVDLRWRFSKDPVP